jgi:hypothetical protein
VRGLNKLLAAAGKKVHEKIIVGWGDQEIAKQKISPDP